MRKERLRVREQEKIEKVGKERWRVRYREDLEDGRRKIEG